MLLRFYLFLAAITLIQVGIVIEMEHLLPVKDTIITILFFAIITAAIYPIAMIGRKSNDGHIFIISTYLSIGLRFILSLCFIIYYKLTRSHYENGFIFAFFLSYIFFTMFEIYWLATKLRPNLKAKASTNE